MANLYSREAARRAACKRQFGSLWMVFTWNVPRGAWDFSWPVGYRAACALVREHRGAVMRGEIKGR
jgi:hypothetical protein